MSDWRGTQDDLFSDPALLRSLFLLCGRKKKIAPNSVLLVFLATALAVNFIHPSKLIYVPVILAVSFALYYVGFWGAGDGKLFFCIAVYLLPFTADALYAVAAELFLAVSLCYFTLFFALFYGAKKSIMRLFWDACKKTFSADTALRLLLSFSVLLALGSLHWCSGCVGPAAFVLLYVLSAMLPRAASIAVALLLFFLLLAGGVILWQYAHLILIGLLFAFFFSLYSVLAAFSEQRDKRMVFAPFLFIASLLIMLLA